MEILHAITLTFGIYLIQDNSFPSESVQLPTKSHIQSTPFIPFDQCNFQSIFQRNTRPKN
uniref:AlNc14C62G4486 protein n=1 Tax=Albugo laibachii Nc14 TaxID=890382 RepID=F0WCV8_9STRA|nr:AlNc14C62G4486 [Albugo laibachii Nc14]|eukprot:CCA19029.1 AlNc14C62G4486 [Albugo laibachii Nc14]